MPTFGGGLGLPLSTKGVFNSFNIITGTTSSSQWIPSNTSLTVVSPDFVKNSGDVIYIENFTPITKATSQTETFKLIFEF